MGSPEITALGFGPENPGSILEASKDRPVACSVRDRKFLCPESPMVGP